MLIGVPRETSPGETRVSATPTTVRALIGLGHEVLVESGAGAAASHPDEAYAEAGARIGTAAEAWGAGLVLHVAKPATRGARPAPRGRPPGQPAGTGVRPEHDP